MVQCNYTHGEENVQTLNSMKKKIHQTKKIQPHDAKRFMQEYVNMFESTVLRWKADKEKFNRDQIIVFYNLIEKNGNHANIDTTAILQSLRTIMFDESNENIPRQPTDEARIETAFTEIQMQV